MKLNTIKESTKPDKKLMAIFKVEDKEKVVHFGQRGSTTYLDGATDEQRANYRARHKVNENWRDPMSPGALSRFILWGETRSLSKNIQAFKMKFGLHGPS